MDKEINEQIIELEQGYTHKLKFSPMNQNIVELELLKKAEKGYDERPDLGISKDDVNIEDNSVNVTVHSIGAQSSPSSTIELRDESGKLIASAVIPSMEAPLDLMPRKYVVRINIPEGVTLKHGSVQLDPANRIKEIAKHNNNVKW